MWLIRESFRQLKEDTTEAPSSGRNLWVRTRAFLEPQHGSGSTKSVREGPGHRVPVPLSGQERAVCARAPGL